MNSKKYGSFSEWAADQSASQKKIIVALRKLVKKASPKLIESVKWTNGVWLGKEWPVLFLHAEDDHLQFGFFGGSDLTDPKRLLQGSGKYVKHIKIYKMSDINGTVLTKFIREAARNERK